MDFLPDVHFYLRSRRIQKIIAEFAINSIVLRRDQPPHYFRKSSYQSLNSRNEPLRIRNKASFTDPGKERREEGSVRLWNDGPLGTFPYPIDRALWRRS